MIVTGYLKDIEFIGVFKPGLRNYDEIKPVVVD
jgi:hypothetical protein